MCMKQVKQFLFPLIIYLLIVCFLYFVSVFFEVNRREVSYNIKEMNGTIVAYEDNENGIIVVVRDLQSEKLKRFQFLGGVSEEVYGKELKNIIENRQYDIVLQINYTEEVKEPAYIVDMAMLLED